MSLKMKVVWPDVESEGDVLPDIVIHVAEKAL